VTHTWDELEDPPTPETLRLGRWLYYDTRLSSDNTAEASERRRRPRKLAAVDARAQSKLTELRESVVAPRCRHGLDENERQRTLCR
jgi:hypothetical protein